MDTNSKLFIEKELWLLWIKLVLNKPANWDDIVNFVIEDVECSSDYLINGDFHSGDIAISFRRFVERDL